MTGVSLRLDSYNATKIGNNSSIIETECEANLLNPRNPDRREESQ